MGNHMENFLQNLIPVSTSIWLGFFLIPAVISLVGQMILCQRTSRLSLRLIPVYAAAAIIFSVILYKCTGVLTPLIGGFAALLLLGTALFVLAGSFLGWLIYIIYKYSCKISK